MSTPYPSLAGRGGAPRHAGVLAARTRERALAVGLGALVPLAVTLALSLALPRPGAGTIGEVVAVLVALVGVFTLVSSRRYALTLALLMLYLGLLDGPLKLLTNIRYVSGFRDVLIIAIGLGMLMRVPFRRQRVAMPPLSGWVLAFVAVVLVEALNPNTNGFLKDVAGYRQELEFVPLFFFGYVAVRSKQRFRQLFLLLGAIALANGAVAAIQYRLTPAALGHWGPGYEERVAGKGGRTYKAEGESHPRPPALGSDAGFGGGIGTIAIPGLLALLSAGRLRRRWPVLLCMLGALLGVATSASRSQFVDLLVVLASYLLLSWIAGLRLTRAFSALAAILALSLGVAGLLVAVDGSGIFKRQSSIEHVINGVSSEASGAEGEEAESGGDAKVKHLNQIPSDIVHDPFGLGLGTAGSVAGLGGKVANTVEEQKVSGGSAYNLLVVELGLPGLALWVGLTVAVLGVALTHMARIEDPELRTYLVGIVAAFLMLTVEGFAAQTLAVTPAGAYLWFAPGVVAYWLAGPGMSAMRRARASTRLRSAPSPPAIPA